MTAKNTTTIRIGGDYAAELAQLLEFCDEFFRHASPAVRAELARYLDQRPAAPDANLLIDSLGLTALFLRAHLTVAAQTQPGKGRHE